jgi:glycosyltransferase involved in cell wall biosynthesis
MRIVFLSGYQHPSAHRKVELLADAPDVELLHITFPSSGVAEGEHPSASGERRYHTRQAAVAWLGGVGDPHRVVFRAALLEMARFEPAIVHCEQEQEGLMAAQVAFYRSLYAPRAALILYSWQNILRRRRAAVRAVSRYTLAAASHMLCASQEAVAVLRQQGYGRGASVMPMFGIDTRYFKRSPAGRAQLRQQLQLTESNFLAGYCGRLVPEKGIDTLLRAAAGLPQVHLLLVGGGPSQPALAQLAAALGISERCHFLPAQPYDAMAATLSALDLLVLPSRTTPNWKEQYGRVLVEAMACGVAVAGADSGAIPEVIGAAGRIFPEGDATALGAILDELAGDPGQRQALAAQGQAQALQRYGVDVLAARILAAWRELAAARAGTRPAEVQST